MLFRSIHDMTQPDFVLIGESDARAGAGLEEIHRTFVSEGTPVRRMSWVNAEIAKIAVNTFVTTKISYANMLAEVCERLPGGDVDVVTDAIGIDRRIGSRYLRGAVGYGGPCFPRDNSALAAAARLAGTHADIAIATDAINRRQVDRLADAVKRHARSARARVSVLGLSYKPDTPVAEESQGVMLANRLAADGLEVSVFDPAALGQASGSLAPAVRRADSLEESVADADLLVVMVPWPAFRNLPTLLRAHGGPSRVTIDCWRMFDAASFEGAGDLVHIGKAAAPQATASR